MLKKLAEVSALGTLKLTVLKLNIEIVPQSILEMWLQVPTVAVVTVVSNSIQKENPKPILIWYSNQRPDALKTKSLVP